MVVIISDRRLFTEPDLVCKPYVDIFGLVTHSSPISAREIVDEEVLINVVRKLCEFFIGFEDDIGQKAIFFLHAMIERKIYEFNNMNLLHNLRMEKLK